jgi:hypothetical protein
LAFRGRRDYVFECGFKKVLITSRKPWQQPPEPTEHQERQNPQPTTALPPISNGLLAVPSPAAAGLQSNSVMIACIRMCGVNIAHDEEGSLTLTSPSKIRTLLCRQTSGHGVPFLSPTSGAIPSAGRLWQHLESFASFETFALFIFSLTNR